jgi:Mg2+ and Co2+ transporter CorA
MPVSVSFIKKLESVHPDLKEILISLLEEVERQREETVTRKDFLEFAQRTEENFHKVWQAIGELSESHKKAESRLSRLEETVEKLVEAQAKAEERLSRLEKAVEKLAEAQKRTEERLNELAEAQAKMEHRLSRLEDVVEKLAEAQKRTEERLNELAEAQKRTEERLNELAEAQKRTEERLNELAEAQKRTEERLNELAEAQKRTEERLNELAEAQKRTEEELKKLIGEHKKTREALGGLTHTVGYILEDRAFVSLPELLKRDMGVEVGELKRDFVEISPARYEEINILGKGRRNGNDVWIIGECKTQLTKKHVDHFLNMVSRLEHIFPGEKIYVVVTYQTSPQVREYLKAKGLKLYFSYQLRL